VLCFDQSLAALGWVWLQSTAQGLRVLALGSITTNPKDWPTGHEGTLQRAVHVATEIRQVVQGALGPETLLGNLDAIAHETPPVASHMSRPESSLLAALGVRLLAETFALPVVMIANQHSKSVLTGHPNTDKKGWHLALSGYDIAGPVPKNEGQRDAACLAVTYFLDRSI